LNHHLFLELVKLVECYLNHLQNLKNRRYLKHHHLSRRDCLHNYLTHLDLHRHFHHLLM
jgi:hypothetical protein